MIKHHSIKSIILNFENKYPVSKWNINGIDIWPNIRFKLYFHLLNHLEEENNSTVLKVKSTHKKKPFNKIILRLIQVSSLLKYYKFKATLKDVDYLFIGLKMHRVFFERKWCNRFFDPIIDTYKTELKFMHFEIDKLVQPINNASISYSLSDLLQSYSLLTTVKSKFTKSENITAQINVLGFEEFYEEISRMPWNSKGLKMDLNYWINWVIKVSGKKRFFINYFNKAKVKGVVIASYYGYEDTAAAILAANELNIPVADYQHGPQTKVHMAYADWTSLPKNGYNTMPTHYWCWDDKSSKTINKWNSGNRAIPLGNTWLQYSLSNKVKKTKKYIMYSLQVVNTHNIKYFFTESILDLIRSTSIEWKIRIHPRSVFRIEEIETFLTKEQISVNNYHLEMAHNKSMLESLYESKIHITNFSGCLIEAYQLGVPSMIIDQIGLEFYKDYVDLKKVVFKDKYDNDFKAFYLNFLNNSKHYKSVIDSEIKSPQHLFDLNN